MSLELLTTPFSWTRYSKKILTRFEKPHNNGAFTQEEASKRGMRLIEGAQGSIDEGNWVILHMLLDLTDGMILDARFHAWGGSALIAAADVACDLLVSKHYSQASRLTADLIDKQLRDEPEKPAFPKETYSNLYLVLGAIVEATDQCFDLPAATGFDAPPVPKGSSEGLEGSRYPGWELLPLHDRQAVLEEVLDREIRPYIALDAGGVILKELTSAHEVLISYTGSCTSCYSSVGSTLAYIQHTLRTHVYADIVVIPETDL